MAYRIIQKMYALLAGLGITALTLGTIIVLTSIPIITLNHLVGLWVMALVTGFSLWRFTEIEKKTQPNTNP